MHKMTRKVLSLALALALCLALLPAAALAADSDFTIENGVLTKYNGPGGAVTIPDGVTSIGGDAFFYCENLTSVTIPNSVTRIEDTNVAQPGGAFSCTGLTSVTIPGSVISIGCHAFSGCSDLTSVTILSGVTDIGMYAFLGCTSLTSVTIPSSVTEIYSDSFEGTPWMKNLGDLAIVNGILLRYQGSGGHVTIPSSINSIGGWAFDGCTGLTDITISEGVTSIGLQAFSYCTNLTSVTIPSSVTSIGGWAFNGCTALKDIYYGGSEAQWKAIKINEMGDFKDCLTNATIHYNSTGSDQPSTLPTVENIAATGTAVAQTQNVLLDGKTVQFQYYAVKDANGNMTNYVKLRDLAQALSGTKAQFNVGWDGKISITSNTAYEAQGTEGSTPYSGDQPYTAVSDTPVSFNGSDVNLTSFQLKDSAGSGYTYYKLRDLGQLLNFNVAWNGSSIVVESDKPYTG